MIKYILPEHCPTHELLQNQKIDTRIKIQMTPTEEALNPAYIYQKQTYLNDFR